MCAGYGGTGNPGITLIHCEVEMDPAELSYGSDKHGLVWGYLFVTGQPAVPLDSDTAAAWLAEATSAPSDTFLWLHFSLANTASERWLRKNTHLPDAFYEALIPGAGSTRLEQESGTLVAVMHDVLFDFSFDTSAVSTVTICVDKHLLVSARHRPLRAVDRLRAVVKTKSFRSAAELLAQLLEAQAGVLEDIVRQSTVRIDTIEDGFLANRVTLNRSELGALRRTLVRLQRLLAPEPAAFFRLLNRPPLWISGDDLQAMRQAAEEFSTAVIDSAALIERVKLLQEEITALITERTNRSLFILTIVTVLALPINLTGSLFGMNVGGIPFADYPHGFLIVVALLAAFTALLAYFAFGRRRE